MLDMVLMMTNYKTGSAELTFTCPPKRSLNVDWRQLLFKMEHENRGADKNKDLDTNKDTEVVKRLHRKLNRTRPAEVAFTHPPKRILSSNPYVWLSLEGKTADQIQTPRPPRATSPPTIHSPSSRLMVWMRPR